MIKVALYQRFGPVHVCLLPCQVFAHLTVGIAVTVGLVVGLVHHVDAPSVAQLVQVFAVRIMTGAQKVDVGLLHQPQVLLVGGVVHVAPRPGVVVVAVHTAQLHVLAVNLKHLAYHFYLLYA